uniref:NADH-ubiquinone oxidoreductase chain 2 n=1 Tax=Ampullaceana balthica TaxID=582868 RepID=A0A0C4ZPK0_AMPBA|nr:NADH dehydrogenase subunit 2 [Ampullaceana balthica]
MYFLIFGPILSVSSSNWVLCWSGKELGFFSLMPLLLMNNISTSKEVVLKYFSIQAFSSVLLFFSGMMIFGFLFKDVISILLFMLSMSLKLGFFPGHFWVPSVVSGLDWFSCCLILGPLKVAPFALLVVFLLVFPDLQLSVMFLGVLSAFYGSILGNNQTSVRGMIGSSSISHTGWMINALIFGYIWAYFLVYMLTLFMFLLMMMKMDYFSASMNLLSMSGLPPFLVFIMKINILFSMINMNVWVPVLILIIGSFISLIFYLKFSYSLILNMKNFRAFSLFLFFSLNLLGVFYIFFGGRF